MTRAIKWWSSFIAALAALEVLLRSKIALRSCSLFETDASLGCAPSRASTKPSKPPAVGVGHSRHGARSRSSGGFRDAEGPNVHPPLPRWGT